MRKLTLLLLLSCIALVVMHAEERYIYRQISQNEGLTSTVNCIYKERDGDVWIGTPNGMFRFNGYSLKSYARKLEGSRRVFQIKMDHRGDMWVLTDRHVFRRDAGTDTFRKISSIEDIFFCMCADREGIWIGSVDKIYRYCLEDGSFKACFSMPSGIQCRSICKFDDNTLLCCSHSGKILVDTKNGDITKAHFGDIDSVYDALIDSKGRIWFALYNNGIEVYEKDGTRIRTYNTGNSSLSNNLALCLAEKDSLVLAGTDGGGINIIDLENDRITVLSHISGDKSSLPAHSIKSIHVDNYGNIWAGSIRDGLIELSKSGITSYQETHLGLNNGLSNPTVLCLHQDEHDRSIWIGTDGEGINRFDPRTKTFTHFSSTFKKKVVSIAGFSRDELVLSTYADRILIFNRHTGNVRDLPLADDGIKRWISHSGRSVNLYNEEDGDLLLFANTIFRYDKQTRQCTQIKTPDEKLSYSNFVILGCSSEGIWMHNFSNIYLLKDDADTLILKGTHKNGEIRSGHLVEDGTIWMATEEGLCCFNTADDSFRHITTTIFSDANSVVCDKHSRVWVGTDMGLSAYLTESESFTLFGESDGAEPNEYLPKPHLLTREGDVYLGGVQGLLRIHSDYSIDTSEIPELKFSGLSVDGSTYPVDRDNMTVKVPRHSKSMDIEVGVMERDMFRHRLYRFALSDKEVYETTKPYLKLQRMPAPGTYNVKVSCTRRNGEWTEPFSLMTLKIPQPWYRTWWFIGTCLLFLSLIYATAIYSINRRKANELKMAMRDQEQKVYEEKVQMLINISHELRTPLTLIMSPLKRLLKDISPDDSNFPVMSRIYRQSRRMRSLLDMVLDLRKMEVGNKLKIESVEFNTWIAGCTEDIVNEEKAEGINLVYDFDPAAGHVDLDRQKCDIVLMNILINAIKHSSAGDTVTIKTSLTDDGMIRTSISDQGPGLGKDIDLSKMFTQFYQSNSEKYGSGIGLSYSKILVELHGGNIGVYNNPDKGATFWWELPVSSAQSSSDTEPRAYLNELLGYSTQADTIAPLEDNFSTAGMKLMIVDDNQDLLDFLREALCQDFAEVITVTGGNPALRELKNGRLPDIIVSDVNMPDGDGFRLCSELKKSEKLSHIPVVLLTARGEDQSQSDSYRIGADGFLAKPFEVETLMEIIRGLLRNKAEIRKRYFDKQEQAQADYGSNEESFILQLNRIISEHLSDPGLDQQLICMELGVSRALLYNKMKAITGAGAKEYITKIRIEKAKSLIETTSLSIAEISEMTGFSAQSYFSTAFKNYTGMTPSRYKSSCRSTD